MAVTYSSLSSERAAPWSAPTSAVRSPFRWRHVLTGGITIWALMLVALLVTKNTALLPAVALLGAGTIPLSIVLRNGERLSGTGYSTPTSRSR